MQKTLALASLISALALGTALAGDTKEGWGWTFTKGEKVRYAYVYNVEFKFEVMGMPQVAKQQVRLELIEETTEAKDDGATIQATVDRVVVKVESPPMMGGTKLTFDTDEAKEEPKKDDKKKDDKKKKDDDDDDDDAPKHPGGNPLEGVRSIVGEKFSFHVAKDGSISDMKGLDKITEKVTAKLGAEGSAFVDPEVFQQTLDLHCHVFPAAGGSGDSWDLPTTCILPGFGKLTFKRTITPKGEAEGGIKLVHTANKPEFEKVEKGAGAANPMAAALGKPKVKDTGFDGKSVFSREKGRVLSDELTATMTTELSVDNPMGGNKKGMGGDDDDDDAPKKKDDKKDKEKKKGDDDESDNGGNKIKIVQKFKLVLKYELMGDKKSTDEKKTDEKKKGDF